MTFCPSAVSESAKSRKERKKKKRELPFHSRWFTFRPQVITLDDGNLCHCQKITWALNIQTDALLVFTLLTATRVPHMSTNQQWMSIILEGLGHASDQQHHIPQPAQVSQPYTSSVLPLLPGTLPCTSTAQSTGNRQQMLMLVTNLKH